MSLYLQEFHKEAIRRARNIAYIEGYEPMMAYKEKVLLRELESEYYVIGEYDYDTRDLKLIGRKRKREEDARTDFFSVCLPQLDQKEICEYVTDTQETYKDILEQMTTEQQAVTQMKM